MYVVILLIVDLAYAFIDPRIRAQYTKSSKKKKQPANMVTSTAVEPGAQTAAAAVPAGDDLAKPAVQAVSETQKEAAPQAAQRTADEPKQRAKADDKAFVSFATRTDDDFSYKTSAKSVADSGKSAIREHKKRSRSREVFHHLVRNPSALAGMIIIAIILALFIASQFISWTAVTRPNIQYIFSAPSLRFPFGTDFMGRCLFTRVIYATRFSLPIGVGATAVATLFGVFLGSLAAYYEGSAADEVIMRFSDSLASIPGILLGMVIITTLGRSVPNLIIAIGVAAIPFFIRMARASVLTIKGNEFVEAAKAVGLSNFRILYTQVLPNGLAPIIVSFTGSLGMAILISAGLSFLGFGIPIPNPEWGSLVAEGRGVIRLAPWVTTFPGLLIMITVMGFNLLGDGLRDAFDPKLKK